MPITLQLKQQFVNDQIAALKALSTFAAQIDYLNNLYLGDNIGGTITDQDLQNMGASYQHLTAANITGNEANLNAVRAAITAGMLQTAAYEIGQ